MRHPRKHKHETSNRKPKEEKDASENNFNLQTEEKTEFEIQHKQQMSNLKDEIDSLKLTIEERDLFVISSSEEN